MKLEKLQKGYVQSLAHGHTLGGGAKVRQLGPIKLKFDMLHLCANL